MSDQQKPKATTDRLRDHAEASSDSLEPVELLADDFMRRQRAGETPTIEEYCARHPELADEIREVFPALVVIERFAPDSVDLEESARTLYSPDHLPIDSIGDYRILREIGRGGMGVVYEAEQESLGRRVALKVLPRHVASDEKALLRFRREARAAAKMHHTNIVPVFEVGRDKEHSFYAMQLIQGQGLDHVIADLRELRSQVTGKRQGEKRSARDSIEKSLAASLMNGHFEQQNLLDSGVVSVKQPSPDASGLQEIALTETAIQSAGSTASATLPGQSDASAAEDNRKAYFRSVAEIGLQAARALSYAHARGIIHRDIKPSNLILDTGGVVWITDFGLARTGDSAMTQTGDILGTIRYMSPERFKGQCDNRADMYSLGLTLYEMLVLKPAFESPDRLQLIDIVTKTDVTAPRSIDSRVPRDLETIVLKASDKDPRRRYQSADDMADDLQRFLNDEPILARRTSSFERVARWARRNPWLATAMLVAAVALIAVAGISALAAQEQSRLNSELRAANDEQRDTNEALQRKTIEQHKTNEALVDSNRTKEELIRDLQRRETELKHSQSRLAEKQAEFTAEKGNLAEAMLWLARAYEMSEGQAEEIRRSLLAKLSILAEKVPRLQREVNVPTVTQAFRQQLLEQIEARLAAQENSAATGSRIRPELLEALRSQISNGQSSGGNFVRGGFGGGALSGRGIGFGTASQFGSAGRGPAGIPNLMVAEDQALIPFATRDLSETRDPITSFRFWDTRTSSWAGPAIHVGRGVLRHALHHGRKLFAVSLRTPIFADDPEPAGNAELPRRVARFLVQRSIYDISTGKVISQTEQETSNLGGLFQEFRFTPDGSRLIMVDRGSSSNAHKFNITFIDTDTGQAQQDDGLILQIPVRRRVRSFALSEDCRRLVCAWERRTLPSGRRRGGNVICYDLATGEQVGQPIEFDRASPLVITPDASQIAIARSLAGRIRIEVHDVESGKQIGEAIEPSIPLGTEVHLLNTSPDRSQIIVGTTHRRNLKRASDPASPQQIEDAEQAAVALVSDVQVFDLTSSRPVTPPLPTRGSANFATLSSQDQTLSVAAVSGTLRVWKFPESAVHPTMLPYQRVPSRLGKIASALFRAAPAGNAPEGLSSSFLSQFGGTISRVATGPLGQLLTMRIDNGISLDKWDGESGRLIRSTELADLNNEFAGPVSSGGRFLLTVRPVDVENWVGQEQLPYSFKSFRMQIRCWQMDPVQQIGVPVTLEENQIPVGLSPDGNWIAVRTVTIPGVPGERFGPGGSPAQFQPGSRFQAPGSSGPGDPESTDSEDDPLPQQRPQLQLLHRTTGELRSIPQGPFVVDDAQFSGDGRRLAVYGRRVQLFDLSTESTELIATSPPRGALRAATTRGNGLGRSSVEAWAINYDGTLLAELVDETTLQIRQLASGEIIGNLMDHPAAIEDVCFDLEGKTVVTACADGLIRQWLLPEEWSGNSQEIQQRVNQHAGVAFMEDDIVFAQPMTDRNTVGPEWLSDDSRGQLTLTQSQRAALRHRFNEDWEAADSALLEWSQQHPEVWLPLVLRIRPLGQQGKLEEATKVWQQASERINGETLAAWAQLDLKQLENAVNSRDGGSLHPQPIDLNSIQISFFRWYYERLQTGQGDAILADLLYRRARLCERDEEFDEAVRVIDQAVTLPPDSAEMHSYRAHLMGRLGRWDAALESREKVRELEPDNHFHYFKVLAFHLFLENEGPFWEVWRAMQDKWADSDEPRAPERLAKPALILGQPGEELGQALQLADRAFENREGFYAQYDIQAKGLAEFRRGEFELQKENTEAAQRYFKDALQYTQECFKLFVEHNRKNVTALAKFQEAMILQRMGRRDQARSAYFDGVDYHNIHLRLARSSTTSVFTDWLLNEALRRQAEQILEMDKQEFGFQVPDTDAWEVLYEEDFSESISESWTSITGEWTVVDGAACGSLDRRSVPDGFARLEQEDLNLPKTVEIAYDTWWSEPLISACFLRTPTDNPNQLVGHRFALCHMPDPNLTSQGESGVGFNIVRVLYPWGDYYSCQEDDDSLEVNRTYHVRILRTPGRITTFVEGKQVASTRICDQDAAGLRFFARGPRGAKVYFDNLRIRVPISEQE